MEEKDHLNCKISAFFTTPTPATAIIRTMPFTAQKRQIRSKHKKCGLNLTAKILSF